MTTPWVEQYRPRDFAEVYHQEQAVAAFKQCLVSGQLPHLLLFGPQGTGKTTCIQALAHQLFGPLFYKERVLEINASSDRGVAVIRETVKPRANRKISATKPADYPYPVPALQIIILEEADALTRDAQAALRRIIEDCSATTRLALLCNYPSQIIGPIVSRCAKFRFAPLPSLLIQNRLSQIAQKEAIKCDSQVLLRIAEAANGDMRKAVTQFQMIAQAADLKQGMKQVSAELFDQISRIQGVVTQKDAVDILQHVTALGEGEDTKFLHFIDELHKKNFDVEELANAIYDALMNQQITDKVRIAVAGEYQKFGQNIARRCGEKLAIQKMLIGVRVATTLK